MKRVFENDFLVCPYCEGKRKLIAFLTDGCVVRKLLDHLGLDSEPPIPAPARAIDEAYVAQPTEMSPWFQDWAVDVGLHRAVCDYVAGMTDRFAEQEFARLG